MNSACRGKLAATIAATVLLAASAEAQEPWAAVLVDRSTSMQGFAQEIPGLLEDFDHAIAGMPSFRQARSGSIRFFGVTEAVEAIPDLTSLYKSSTYLARRADLAKALTADVARDSALSIVLTDGQPSPSGSVEQPCMEATRPDLSELTQPIADLLAGGKHSVWLWLDRVPFAGEIYLNCSKLRPVRQGEGKFEITCDGSKECHASYEGDRTILALVTVTADRHNEGIQFVESLLKTHPRSQAIALWREDQVPDGVTIEHKEWRASGSPEKRQGDKTNVEVTCHERSAGEPVKPRVYLVTLKSPASDAKGSRSALWGLGELKSQIEYGGEDKINRRVFELPSNIGVDGPMVDSAPRLSGACEDAFARFQAYARSRRGGVSPCESTRESCRQFVVLCDCGLPKSTPAATIVISVPIERRVDQIVTDLRSREMIAGDRGHWSEQLDRLAGLDRLLVGIADAEDERLGGAASSRPVGTIEILVKP